MANTGRIYARNREELASVRNTYRGSTKTDEMQSQIEDLQGIVFAMWRLLKEKGVTDEDLNAQLVDVLKLKNVSGLDNLKPTMCPKCNKRMQHETGFVLKCPYCKYKLVQHPYMKYNAVVDGVVDPDATIDTFDPNANKDNDVQPVKEYDLDADLRFDEL